MSYFATVGERDGGDVATSGGWHDFAHFVETLSGVNELRQLTEYGWADDGEALAADLRGVIESADPTPDQLSIAHGLLRLAEVMGEDVITVSDGSGMEETQQSELGDSIRLAQVAIPRSGFRVPQASQVVNQGLREFDRLFDALVNAMAHRATKATLDGIRNRIVTLEADLRIAGRVLGMLSPWQPRVNTYADGAGMDADRLPAITLADKRWRFPWISDAIDFLAGKEVVTAEEFAKLADADRTHVFSAPGIDDAGVLKSLQKKLAKSLELGEDLRTFRKSIEGEVALTRAQTETMYRTETKRGYVAGFDKAMRSPVVAEEFPAVLYTATPDQRVRDEHWDLDQTVVLRSDRQAYRVLQRAANDFNCRCSMIPLSLAEAESRGISTYNDLPPEAKAKYG